MTTNRDGFQPGRSEDLSHRIELAFTADPAAVISAAGFAQAIEEPLSIVSYCFLRLEQEGKVEQVASIPKGPTIERLYRAPATTPTK